METKTESAIGIRIGRLLLPGELNIPSGADGLVIFAHGSGSSRWSPRNRKVAAFMQEQGLATLLFDLLTEEEDQDVENRFDIELLTHRLMAATHWAQEQEALRGFATGYFGASTGAASALKAAARLPDISAVVSRGGRPDLAGKELSQVKVPTLLIVGSLDEEVMRLNKEAILLLAGEKKLEVVPGATHLFPEPGALGIVCELAGSWFHRYLKSVSIHP